MPWFLSVNNAGSYNHFFLVHAYMCTDVKKCVCICIMHVWVYIWVCVCVWVCLCLWLSLCLYLRPFRIDIFKHFERTNIMARAGMSWPATAKHVCIRLPASSSTKTVWFACVCVIVRLGWLFQIEIGSKRAQTGWEREKQRRETNLNVKCTYTRTCTRTLQRTQTYSDKSWNEIRQIWQARGGKIECCRGRGIEPTPWAPATPSKRATT